jgi:hypothetical protein
MTKSVDKYPIYDRWEQPAPHPAGDVEPPDYGEELEEDT